MADVSAALVAELRKATGAGMLDCKNALVESGGDIEAAKEWLRKKGLAGAAKRAGRSAEDGAVEVLVEDGVGAIVELTAETDFVAKGTDFGSTVSRLARIAVDEGSDELHELELDGGTVGEHVTQLAARLGENIALGRVVVYESGDGILDGYKHVQNLRGTIGVLVELAGVDRSDDGAREVAHDLALHIASAAPRYVQRADVPADEIERERAIYEAQTRDEGKPEQAVPKIVDGKLNGYYRSVVLLEQGFVKEPKQTIEQLVRSVAPSASVRRFVRVKIGEE
jgi:elongation factor Ts